MQPDQFDRLYYQPVREALKKGELTNFRRSDLKEIDKYVKQRLSLGVRDVGNSGFPQNSLQAKFLNLQFYLRKSETEFKKNKPPILYKALSILLDFREYLGGISPEQKITLEQLAHEWRKEMQESGGPMTPVAREQLKEQIRLFTIHANQKYRDGKYLEALELIKTLKETIAERLQATNKCRTVLAGLHYLEGRVLRNLGKYPDCEKTLSDAIEFYTDWSRDHPFPPDLLLASYKNAMCLGAIAWCKNMRGFNRDALNLINAARLLISKTQWELDKAHLDMVYADISRTFMSEKADALKTAIAIARNSYAVFDKHPHERLRSRAAFTLGLLNFYAGEMETGEKYIDEVEEYSKEKEARWYSNALILRARIRIKQDSPRVALDEILPQAIEVSQQEKLSDREVVAYIIKGEAHLKVDEYQEAIAALETAHKVNDRSRDDHAVNSERNKGWIFLYLSTAYLRLNDFARSKACLENWRGLRGIKYQWLRDYAAVIEREHRAAAPEFVISSDSSLDWRARKDDLLLWLIDTAKLRTKSSNVAEVAKELNLSKKWVTQLQKEAEDRAKSRVS